MLLRVTNDPPYTSQAIIPYIPTDRPRLGHLVYEMILAYFLANDRQVRTPRAWELSLLTAFKALQRTIHDWPKDIYDISAVIIAVQSELDRYVSISSRTTLSVPAAPDTIILMECLAEL